MSFYMSEFDIVSFLLRKMDSADLFLDAADKLSSITKVLLISDSELYLKIDHNDFYQWNDISKNWIKTSECIELSSFDILDIEYVKHYWIIINTDYDRLSRKLIKINVGDQVVCTTNGTSDSIVEVTEIEQDLFYFEGYYAYIDEVRLATQAELDSGHRINL